MPVLTVETLPPADELEDWRLTVTVPGRTAGLLSGPFDTEQFEEDTMVYFQWPLGHSQQVRLSALVGTKPVLTILATWPAPSATAMAQSMDCNVSARKLRVVHGFLSGKRTGRFVIQQLFASKILARSRHDAG